MYIKPFAVEEWMNEYEVGARFNIAETCVDSVSLDELFALAGADKAQFLTDFRTGAAGAIGAKYLARPDAETLLMAGTGALAPYLIAATLYLLPQTKTVYVTNPHHPECSAAACEAITPQVEKLLSGCGGCHAATAAALLQAAQETGKGQTVTL